MHKYRVYRRLNPIGEIAKYKLILINSISLIMSLAAFAEQPQMINDRQSFDSLEVLYLLNSGGSDQHLWIRSQALQTSSPALGKQNFEAPILITVSFPGLSHLVQECGTG